MQISAKALPGARLIGSVLLGAAVSGFAAVETLPLKYKTYREWTLVLPQESFKRVSGDFRFPATSPDTFATRLDGSALRIDKNADGELAAKVEGEKGVVTLRGKTKDGDKFLYAVRLKKTLAGWVYSASGAALGMIDNQKIRIIDQNNNGRYDDYGVDAMVLGQGRYASFLSRVINIRGKLYSIEVSADGTSLSHQPYTGPTGTLDLATEFATKGKLLSTIVRSPDHSIAFNMTGGALTVPAGDYRVLQGRIGLGRNEVTFSGGEIPAIQVAANGRQSIAFGEPINIDFRYVRQPGRVIMAPQLVRYVGRAGEVYDNWAPFGGSPRFEVKDLETGKQIALAIFGGT